MNAMEPMENDAPRARQEPGTGWPGSADGAARRYARMLLLWVPVAACLSCLLMAWLATPPTPVGVPVTGTGLPAAPTLTPAAPGAPQPTAPPPPREHFSYKLEAMRRLEACAASFHQFFIIEQVIVRDPQRVTSQDWRLEASAAMADFEDGCAALGALPAVPRAYEEADRWLKLAAGEVDSAARRFDGMLLRDDASQVYAIAGHLRLFIEYTRNAEEVIRRLEERKEL